MFTNIKMPTPLSDRELAYFSGRELAYFYTQCPATHYGFGNVMLYVKPPKEGMTGYCEYNIPDSDLEMTHEAILAHVYHLKKFKEEYPHIEIRFPHRGHAKRHASIILHAFQMIYVETDEKDENKKFKPIHEFTTTSYDRALLTKELKRKELINIQKAIALHNNLAKDLLNEEKPSFSADADAYINQFNEYIKLRKSSRREITLDGNDQATLEFKNWLIYQPEFKDLLDFYNQIENPALKKNIKTVLRTIYQAKNHEWTDSLVIEDDASDDAKSLNKIYTQILIAKDRYKEQSKVPFATTLDLNPTKVLTSPQHKYSRYESFSDLIPENNSKGHSGLYQQSFCYSLIREDKKFIYREKNGTYKEIPIIHFDTCLKVLKEYQAIIPLLGPMELEHCIYKLASQDIQEVTNAFQDFSHPIRIYNFLQSSRENDDPRTQSYYSEQVDLFGLMKGTHAIKKYANSYLLIDKDINKRVDKDTNKKDHTTTKPQLYHIDENGRAKRAKLATENAIINYVKTSPKNYHNPHEIILFKHEHDAILQGNYNPKINERLRATQTKTWQRENLWSNVASQLKSKFIEEDWRGNEPTINLITVESDKIEDKILKRAKEHKTPLIIKRTIKHKNHLSKPTPIDKFFIYSDPTGTNDWSLKEFIPPGEFSKNFDRYLGKISKGETKSNIAYERFRDLIKPFHRHHSKRNLHFINIDHKKVLRPTPIKQMMDKLNATQAYGGLSMEDALKEITAIAIMNSNSSKNNQAENLFYSRLAQLIDFDKTLSNIDYALSNTHFKIFGHHYHMTGKNKIPYDLAKITDKYRTDVSFEVENPIPASVKVKKYLHFAQTKSNDFLHFFRDRGTQKFYENFNRLIVLKEGVDLLTALNQVYLPTEDFMLTEQEIRKKKLAPEKFATSKLWKEIQEEKTKESSKESSEESENASLLDPKKNNIEI